ncbi:unnamed protein product [Caenorhabditis sp. 36 PRJEB53466]|nr:unnamed protein product [Caenorhabditis sp. 36 PRJEB53466]
MFVCTSKADSSREPKKAKSLSIPLDTSVAAQEMAQPSPPAPVPTNEKSQRRDVLDSIKIRKKNVRKPRQLKEKKEETDSQHTEVINVPLGKASESATGVSKLTSPADQKVTEKPGGKKIQFAEKLVRSTLTSDAGRQTLKSPDTK